MTDTEIRALNARLGFPGASAERWLHDLRADERREVARRAEIASERWPYATEEWLRYAAAQCR